MFRRKVLGVLAVLLALALLAVYLLWNPVAEMVVQEGLRGVAARGGNLGWRGLSVSGTTVKITSLNGWVPVRLPNKQIKVPLAFDAEDLMITTPLWSLLTGAPSATFSIRGYGGQLDGVVQGAPSAPTVSATLRDLNVAAHPVVQSLGIQSAVAQGSVSDLTLPSSQTSGPMTIAVGAFDLSISRLTIPSIPQQLTLVLIPKIENGSGYAR